MTGQAFLDGAQWYDAFSGGEKRLAREGTLLLRALGSAPLPQVLDLACGTGVHSLFFAEHGADVVAFDLSPDMIRRAKTARPHPRIAYGVGDMRMPPEGPFGLAVCLGNSLSLLPSAEDFQAFFKHAADVLVPGGTLIVQMLNYANPALGKPRQRVETVTVDGFEVTARKTFTPQGDCTDLLLEFAGRKPGEPGHVLVERAQLRHWSLEDVQAAANPAGLALEAVLGDFAGAPYVPEISNDLIALLRRP